MKLKQAKIINFRSIQDVRIEFDPSTRILVGINESGKSNILKALSMIGEDFSPKPEDVREPLPKEKPITEAYIWFIFSLNKKEIEKIYSISKTKLLSKKITSPLLKTSKKELSLQDYCNVKTEGLYSVDLLTQAKSGSHWAVNSAYSIVDNWKKPSPACPADFQVLVGTENKNLKDFSLVNTSDYPEIPNEYLVDADASYVNKMIGEEIVELIEESLPKVIFWQYNEKNLLPPSVDMDAFSANPDTCIPLKNMFILAGIKDIGNEIKTAKNLSQNKLRNLLRRVATHSTNHFRSVWKEYKEIKFALEPNANTIEANIVEQNYWQMSQRSDGLKRFITFLLHVSANVKSNVLSDSLLLVDEPDMSLHPSGCKYLRDELIETGKKNNVIFSTHSIFMIDKDKVDRHIIVKKENEKTTATNVTKSNFVDEEVLFNALNFTVFDILKKDNIIFEGWRDKRLFQVAITKIPTSHTSDLSELKKQLKTLGVCHTDGVKDIRNITPLIELANRNCIIISDADAPAKEKQKEYEKMQGYGTWKRYDEIAPSLQVETTEDFIKQDIFLTHLSKIKKNNQNLTSDPVIGLHGRMTAVKNWLLQQGIKADRAKEILNDLKDEIFNDVKNSDIDTRYYDFLKDFSTLISTVIPTKN